MKMKNGTRNKNNNSPQNSHKNISWCRASGARKCYAREKMEHTIKRNKPGKSRTKNKLYDASSIVSTSYFDILNDTRILSYLYKIAAFDDYIYEHSINVSILAALTAEKLNYGADKVKEIAIAGLFHDAGKCLLKEEVLNKKGTYNLNEYQYIKTHPVLGYRFVKEEYPFFGNDILKGILHHHENEVGTGYPYGLKSSRIHKFGKIISVCDVYDALTSERSYKKALSPFESIQKMIEEKQRYDEKVFANFINIILRKKTER